MSETTPDHDPFSRRRFVFWLIIALNVLAYGFGAVGFYQYQQTVRKRPGTQAAESVAARHAAGSANQTTGSSLGQERLAPTAARLNACYHALQLFILHTPQLEGSVPLTLEIARWVAPVAFGALTLFAFWRKFRRQVRRLWLMLRWRPEHTIICGLGEKGLALVRCHRGLERKPVVVIEQDPQNPLIGIAEQAGAVVLIGTATDEAILREARLKKAKRLVAVCGEDGTNVEIGSRVQKFMRDRKRKGRIATWVQKFMGQTPLDCVVHMSSLNLLSAFQTAGIAASTTPDCRLKFFDIYEFSADELLSKWPLCSMPTDSAEKKGARLIILGFGRMGRAVLAKAAETAKKNSIDVEAWVFDRRADAKKERFEYRFRNAPNCPRIEYISGEVDSKPALDKAIDLCRDPKFQPMIVLTTDSDILNTELALRFLEDLKKVNVRIAVRLTSVHGLATLFKDSSSGLDLTRLHAFGMIRDMCCQEAYM